ncbi:hypothetical protein PTSG_04729 [Salpingoeca rosetta]|uniref:HEAT repeat-containing protein 1 n=1 Tax=Salpingoeca rosetta (strain ATCC 50818 / BSB-021) TaxID=946362 RepID=F2U9J3_SALR5|nr:uncharacterized protein PTSG_04729 [Salpingoeca rosetta]EGD73020.1 hypothetical protein PTSG_04729 [Salpingoeca rosetta]|eukprot:XP_004994051.1 hypothetical protein PTSG_04729 [Salpingoeca rosetta]
MTTSLASQLKQLAFAQQGVAGATRAHQYASLLFSEKDAQSFTLEEVCEMGSVGYTRLCAVDMASFQPFAPLFGTASLDVKRAMQTKEQNKALDLQISRFMRVLAPHMLMPAAHKCFEWLLRRYQVHMYNVDAIMEAILPYHGTALFTRVVMLLVLNHERKEWHFLNTVKTARVPLDRLSLIRQCNSNRKVLSFICKMVFAAYNNKPVQPSKLTHVTALYASIAAGSITASPTQEVLSTILPFLLRGLKHANKDICGANLIVVAQVATATTLSDTAIEAIAEALCHFQDNEQDMQRLQALSLLCTTQRIQRVPITAMAHLLKRESLSDDLIALAQKFDIDALAQSLVSALCKGSQEDVDKLMELLPTLEACCGQTLDGVIQKHLSARRDSSSILESLRKRRLFGVRFAHVSEHDVNVFMGLQHDDAAVRAASVEKIYESLQQVDTVSQRDKEFLSSNLFSHLKEDDSDDVRVAILSQLHLLLPLVPFDACVDACTTAFTEAFELDHAQAAEAAATAICNDLVAFAQESLDGDNATARVQALNTTILNTLLPAVVFRPQRFSATFAVVKVLAESAAAKTIPLFGPLKKCLTQLTKLQEGNAKAAQLSSVVTHCLAKGVAASSELISFFKPSSHAVMFVWLRILSLGASLLNKAKQATLDMLLTALTSYFTASHGITADDVKRAMLHTSKTDLVCEAVLPMLMHQLPQQTQQWTQHQRALAAVFSAACLADIAAAEHMSASSPTKQSRHALLCAATCPIPQLAQPALRNILPAATPHLRVRILSQVAFAGTAPAFAQMSCMYVMCNAITDVDAAVEAVPAALLGCCHPDTAVRRAATVALRAAHQWLQRAHLSDASAATTATSASTKKGKKGKDSEEAPVADAVAVQECAQIAEYLLQSVDDIISDAANLQQAMAVAVKPSRSSGSGSSKKRAKRSRPYEALMDHLLTWARQTSFVALTRAAQVLRDCDVPARARVALKHATHLVRTSLPGLAGTDEQQQQQQQESGSVTKTPAKKGKKGKKQQQQEGHGSADTAATAPAADADAADEQRQDVPAAVTPLTAAVEALKLLGGMLTPAAAPVVSQEQTLVKPLHELIAVLLVGAPEAGVCAPGQVPSLQHKFNVATSPLHRALAAANTSGHAILALGVLKPDTFAHLNKPTQAKAVELLVALAHTNTVSHDTVREYLAKLPLRAEMIAEQLSSSFSGNAEDEEEETRSKRGKKSERKARGASDQGASEASEDTIVTGFANVTCMLEALEVRDLATVSDVQLLLPVLNSMLASYPTLSDEHQAACHGPVHSLLSVATRILALLPRGGAGSAKAGAAAGTAAELVDVDLVVKVLGEARRADMQNQALLVLSELARLVPRQVISCCMPIFAFLRQPFFQPDDDYTLQVLQRTIEAIVPAIRAGATSKRQEHSLLLDLCGVFVDSFYTFPHHRRRGLFAHLVQTLGVRAFLHVVVLLLMKKEVLDPRGFEDDLSNQFVATSSRVQRARGTGSQIPSFVLSLCKVLPLEDHLHAVLMVMRALMVLPTLGNSSSSTPGSQQQYQQLFGATAAQQSDEEHWDAEQLRWLVTRMTSGKATKPKHVRHWRYLLVNQVLRHVASRGVLRQLAALEQQHARKDAEARMDTASDADSADEEDGSDDEAADEKASSTTIDAAAAARSRRAIVHKLNLQIAELALELGGLYRTQAREAAVMNEEAAKKAAKQTSQQRARASSSAGKNPAGTAEYWRRLRNDASKVIHNAYAVLALDDFVAVCLRLLGSDNVATQQHAVEMIATRVEAVARHKTAVTAHELKTVMPMLPVLAALAQQQSGSVDAEDEGATATATETNTATATTHVPDDRQIKLAQGAAHAIAVMAARYAAEEPDMFVEHAAGILSMIDVSKGTRTFSVVATCMASFAVLGSVLGLKLLPHFPPLIRKVVHVLTSTIALVERDEAAAAAGETSADQGRLSSGVRSQAMLMLQSCLDLATVCVQQFAPMLTQKVLEPFIVACVHPFMCTRRDSPLPEALVGKAIALRTLLAKRVSCRHIVEAVPGCYRQVHVAREKGTVGELADSLRALLGMVEQTIAASSAEAVGRQAAHLFRFFATALQFRSQRRMHQVQASKKAGADGDDSSDEEGEDEDEEESEGEVREAIVLVEGSAISCVCAMVLHMSDQSFRPYFVRLVDWASASVTSATPSSSSSASTASRVVTLARLVQELASRLRHVFVSYFSTLLRTFVQFLTNQGKCLTRLGPDGPDMVKYVCGALSLCFANDRDGFVTPERFSVLAEALTSQLDVHSYALEVLGGVSAKGAGDADADSSDGSDDEDDEGEDEDVSRVGSVSESQEEYLQRVLGDVVPCIVELADKGGEENQLRELNRLIISKCHDPEATVRLGAVKLMQALYERMGEELLSLLPETISVLTELLEDTDSSVETEVHKLIAHVESWGVALKDHL